LLNFFFLKLDSERVVVGSARRVIVGPEGTCGDRAAAVSALVADFRDIALAVEAGDSLPTGFLSFEAAAGHTPCFTTVSAGGGSCRPADRP